MRHISEGVVTSTVNNCLFSLICLKVLCENVFTDTGSFKSKQIM